VATELRPPSRSRDRSRARRGRGRAVVTWLARIVIAAALFFAGLALGRAIENGEGSPEKNTSVRTLVPTTLTPQRTVTVTVTGP
jgi:hypothetical protein